MAKYIIWIMIMIMIITIIITQEHYLLCIVKTA